jgi:hypothetical protein
MALLGREVALKIATKKDGVETVLIFWPDQVCLDNIPLDPPSKGDSHPSNIA